MAVREQLVQRALLLATEQPSPGALHVELLHATEQPEHWGPHLDLLRASETRGRLVQ